MRNNKVSTRVLAAAVVLILTVLSPGCRKEARVEPATTSAKQAAAIVHVATNLPLTGPLGTYGSAVQRGATLAAEDLKKSEPSGPTLQFDWKDNSGDPKNAVSIMQQQFLQPVDVYVSGVKPQTMAIIDQIKAKGLPHFVWIFDAHINKASTNNFRTWVSYKLEPPVYIDYAKRHNAKRVAILYVQLPHTNEEFNEIVVPRLKSEGINAIFIEPFDFGRKDFKDLAVKVRDFRPDLVILNGFQSDLVGMVRSLRPLGVIRDGNTIATYDMLDAAQILGPDELEGIRLVAPVFVTRPNEQTTTAWKAKFKARYNQDPLYTDAFAYDMAMIIHDAAKRAPKPWTSANWIAALRATNLRGVTGPLTFDSDGDLLTPLEVGVFRAGQVVPDTATGVEGTQR